MNQPRLFMLALVAAAGCSNAAGGDDPQPKSTAPARLEKPGLVQFHMRQHFGDLRQIERLLLAGKLEDAHLRRVPHVPANAATHTVSSSLADRGARRSCAIWATVSRHGMCCR
jgi:hypothetical protein